MRERPAAHRVAQTAAHLDADDHRVHALKRLLARDNLVQKHAKRENIGRLAVGQRALLQCFGRNPVRLVDLVAAAAVVEDIGHAIVHEPNAEIGRDEHVPALEGIVRRIVLVQKEDAAARVQCKLEGYRGTR